MAEEEEDEEVFEDEHVIIFEFRCGAEEGLTGLEMAQAFDEAVQAKFGEGETAAAVKTIGISTAEVYDSQRQHYIFLEMGDIYQADDEYMQSSTKGYSWWPIFEQMIGQKKSGNLWIERRKVV